MNVGLPANQTKAHDQLQSQYLPLAITNATKHYDRMNVCNAFMHVYNQSTTGSIS